MRGRPVRIPHPGGGHYLHPLGDPPLDPPQPPDYYIRTGELAPGVWFVLDQDGEPVRGHDCGPFSTERDCRWALERIRLEEAA